MEKRLVLNDSALKGIEKLLSKQFSKDGESYSLSLVSMQKKSEISLNINFDKDGKSLISVYTENSHLQLQECGWIVLSEMLSEVIFISENNDKISGLIISNQGDCSLYSNVDKSLLSSDFSNLSSEKLIAAVALSLAEN